MVFFLGKDVTVKIAAENASLGVGTTTAGAIDTGETDFATALAGGGTEAARVTGVDLSIGAQDEDITYFGMRSTTKAEIKKETTVSITRKKTDNSWDTIFAKARFGIKAAATAWPGLEAPNASATAGGAPAFTHGYRIFIEFEARQSTDEIITIPYCCVQGHTVSVNVDGTQDETLEFMGYVSPVYQASQDTGAVTASTV